MIMTGEGWYQILLDLSKQRQVDYNCNNDGFDYERYKNNKFETYGCGNAGLATSFISLYIIIVTLIMLNLFIAVTLQGFYDIQRTNQSWINDF